MIRAVGEDGEGRDAACSMVEGRAGRKEHSRRDLERVPGEGGIVGRRVYMWMDA